MVIKVLSDKSLVMTKKATLHQRESLVDAIKFLIPTPFNGIDMTQLVWTAEWVDPANLTHMEILNAEEDLRDDLFVVLHFPISSKFTYMSGVNILKLSGNSVDESTEEKYVFKTGEIEIEVEKLNDYFNNIPADVSTEIDQKIAELKAQTDKLAALAEQNSEKMARDLSYTEEGHVNLVDEIGAPMGEGIDVLYQKQLDSKDDGETDLDDLNGDIDDATFVDLDG
jgi:hypothetical protein